MVDYYATLQVMPTASEEVIKSAYKALGKKYHPDNKNYSFEVCEEMMKEINIAYNVLSHSEKRKEYDVQYQKEFGRSSERDSREQRNTEQEYKREEPVSRPTDSVEHESEDGILMSVWRGVERMAQKNRQMIDNAYYDGMSMDNYELVRSFMKNYGFKRQGYAIALEERGLLERNCEGKLVPTERFRLYWR